MNGWITPTLRFVECTPKTIGEDEELGRLVDGLTVSLAQLFRRGDLMTIEQACDKVIAERLLAAGCIRVGKLGSRIHFRGRTFRIYAARDLICKLTGLNDVAFTMLPSK